MTSIGYATLDVIPSFKGLQSELEKGSAGPLRDAGVKGGTQFGDAAGKAGGSRFGTVFKRAAQASLVGVAALGVGAVKLAMDSVSAASDLEESTNKVSQVFGKGADDVFRFSEKAADALGQTNEQARNAAATFGIFGSAAGLADKKNARFAKRMTVLASDLASFNNTDPSQAVEALGAALRGESEPIRAYGVMLDEATLKAEALALGIMKPVKDQAKIQSYHVAVIEGQKKYNEALAEFGPKSLEALKAEANLGTAKDRLTKATEGTIPALTQQQKMLAAQSQIFKQTEVAQGDFARTSDGLANQQRRLKARFEDAKASLGTGLLPIMTEAADFLLDKGIPAFERFADWFTEDGIPALKDFADDMKPVIGGVKDLAGFLNDIPGPAKLAGLGALIGGGAALKIRGGGGGLAGTAGSALGLAKAVRVFETNPAALGGDGVGGGSKGGVVKSLALTGVASIAVAGASTVSIAKISEALAPDLTKQGTFGTPQFGTGLANAEGGILDFSEGKGTGKAKKEIQELTSKAGVFGEVLDLVGNKKVDPSLTIRGMEKGRTDLQKFIAQQVEARKPITPYVTLTGYDRALAQIDTLTAKIHSIPTAGIDNGVPFASGGGSSAGISFNGPINVNANDPREFATEVNKRTRDRAMGGRG